MTKIIGVDNGNEMLETSEGVQFINKLSVGTIDMNKDDIKVNYNGVNYTIGVDEGSANIGNNKHKKINYKVSLLTGIANSYNDVNIDCKVVVGLPVELYNNSEHKEQVKSEILGWGRQTIKVNNKEKKINILDVEVFPESGVVFSDRERFKNERTLVIDLGGSTVDISLWNGLRLEAQKTYKHGMVTLYEQIISIVNNQKNTNFKNSEAKYMINKDKYIINQEEQDITFIKPIIELYVNGLTSWINQSFEIEKVNSIQLIGGGAIMLEEHLKDEYGKAQLFENPGFANANTFKTIGDAIWL
ncbi:ParM/StbA family protein [Clostridium botulinum C]|uniref:ParM/StbA family protein n=1 Tax=Clostridium botulinum TaxID=1491 RepID=UPI001E4E569A|nr:ParM/StbA family protein [Clostridium botulinum]MCD3206754.1 ParM/StbA family protein [Clostridium botulinum C]MCD3209661.1 ParM/StbA family protein [Clostridium botulinum C]MCD3226554.1 ParM/StbA family protein [Clostridium botulinum C]MCD3248988.1 ParM/StbA family protein [Clostridium botulinum C]MCD3257572.1 ParM/StbA family protein [Clostridium botulinum C]